MGIRNPDRAERRRHLKNVTRIWPKAERRAVKKGRKVPLCDLARMHGYDA